MDYNYINNIQSCYVEIPKLLYYSHIPSAIISLIVGFFIYLKSRNLASKILFSISITFSLWTFVNLVTWISVNGQLITLVWPLFGILDSMIYLLSLYFVYSFIEKKDASLKMKIIFAIFLSPIIILCIKNVDAFDIVNCEVIGGGKYLLYLYIFDLIISSIILLYCAYKYTKEKTDFKKQILILTIGIGLFLFSYFTSGFLASYLTERGLKYGFEIEQYGLFGMTVFMGFLAYLIVRFKAFDIKLIGAQALMVALVVLIGSQFFFIQSRTNQILTGITLLLAVLFGVFLVRSVQNEVKRKEELQELMEKLAIANDQLRKLDNAKSEFISIASHQLRTPLTSIKGYASLILEGTYGPVDSKILDPINKMYASNERLIQLVEELLNVSRIELGRMEFQFEKKKVETMIGDLSDTFTILAREKKLYFHVDLPSDPLPEVEVDVLKIREVISNLIDNAIKYTRRGGVTVKAEIVTNKTWLAKNSLEGSEEMSCDLVRITVSDTGIGIPADELPYLFAKFSRGKDTKRLHANGTGLGLYVGRNIVEAHHGRVWVESDGQDKGSRFIIEIPVLQPK